MRLRRLSFVAGWAAVVLLAIVGFAAFGTPSSDTAGDGVDPLVGNMGHTAGAYAGLTFAVLTSTPDLVTTDGDPSLPDNDDVLNGASSKPEPSASADDPLEVDSSGWLTQVQVRSLVERYFDASDVNRAVRVAWCESRFNPESVNLRTGGVGLFQHLPKYWPDRAEAAGFAGADPTDAEASVAAAAWAVYDGGGWDVFTCRG